MRTRMMILIGALLVASATLRAGPGHHAGPGTDPAGRRRPSRRSSATSTSATAAPRSRGTRPATTAIATCVTVRTSTSSASPRRTRSTAFRAEANNVGYRDQRYFADLQSIGKLKATFEFNSNPLYQAQARGYFTGAGSNTLTINDAAQTAIQTSPLNAESALATYGNNATVPRPSRTSCWRKVRSALDGCSTACVRSPRRVQMTPVARTRIPLTK